jgi:hypothetical protein
MRKGTHHTEAAKLRMSHVHTGVKFSDERKANHKAAALKREAERRVWHEAYEREAK